MKHSLTLLLVCLCFTAGAQHTDSLRHVKASYPGNVVYADAGICFARFNPGASVTYNYNVARFFGLGIGCQDYYFHAAMTTFRFVPAIYGELRFNICARRRNQFFMLWDLGVDFYKHNDSYWVYDNAVYTVRKDNGTYMGLGFGYFRRITKRGCGPYASCKFISNSYTANQYDYLPNAPHTVSAGDGTAVMSLGYKF